MDDELATLLSELSRWPWHLGHRNAVAFASQTTRSDKARAMASYSVECAKTRTAGSGKRGLSATLSASIVQRTRIDDASDVLERQHGLGRVQPRLEECLWVA